MPGRNGRGPMGQGPMTGRRMGWCGGVNERLDMPRGPGLGMGRGRGRGGVWQELAALKQQADSLEQTVGELESRIQELEKPTPHVTGRELG